LALAASRSGTRKIPRPEWIGSRTRRNVRPMWYRRPPAVGLAGIVVEIVNVSPLRGGRHVRSA